MKTKIDIHKYLRKDRKDKFFKTSFDQALKGLGVSKAPEKN
jgi:hypothetical protein